MRVSTGYQFDRMQSAVNRSAQSYFEAQYKVSTGKRINRLSDDPSAIEPLVSMRSIQSALNQYGSNLKRANTTFSSIESSLSEVNTIVSRANQLAINGGTATTNQTQRLAMAEEVKSLRERILNLANTKGPNGDYIFAGTSVDQKPFVETPTGLQFNGDSNQVFVEAGPGERMSLTLNQSQQMFTDLLQRMDSLKNALDMGDQSTLNNQSLTDLKNSLEVVNQARGEIGFRTKNLQSIQSDFERRSLDLTGGISDLQEVDISQAITDMKKAETAYQAALQMTSMGSRLSLMDFIRG